MQVALLDDDVDSGRVVVDHLAAAGHRIEWVTPVSRAEARFAADAAAGSPIELLLFDLRPPTDDGLVLLQRLRAGGVQCPVIVMTARHQISNRIGWQQAGADDCLVHPFDLDEMLARIDTVTRRRAETTPRALQVRALSLDFDARTARQGEASIALTAMEWATLVCLARRPGRICSRAEIEHSLSGEFGRAQRASNAVEVIVSRLRRKLGPKLITTHRGLGYRLER
jgi:two-component system, OmpR family, response regulator